MSPSLKLENKHRPVFSDGEVLALVGFLESNIQQTQSLGLQPTLAKLQNLKFKIQANISKPAYVTTGIPSGRKGWSAQAAGNLGVDESGELRIVETQADILRNGLAEEKEKFLAMTTQGTFAAKEHNESFSIDSIILAGAAKGYESCIKAIDQHYATSLDSQSASKLWKHIDLTHEDMKHLFSSEQLIWIQQRR